MRLLSPFPALALAAALFVTGAAGCKSKPKATEVKDVVNITVDENGFTPSHFPAKRGRPITLVFNRTSDKTCATAVIIASEKIRKDLPLNATTMVSFIPEKAGEVHFACPMNMVTGEITVLP